MTMSWRSSSIRSKTSASAEGGGGADEINDNDAERENQDSKEEKEQSDRRGGRGRGDGTKKKLRAIRQHVNPLSSLYQQPVELPDGWISKAFAQPTLPFHIDIGSARGRFCVDMALKYPDTNFLGLEIRRPCVEEAFKKLERSGARGNCHFLALNANVDLERVVHHVQEHSQIIRYSIQFPDPQFKKKHKKRSMVQPGLVATVCQSLKADTGEILLQSDVEEVAVSMRESFALDSTVVDVCAPDEWMADNPLGVPTEREKLTLSKGDPVYRTVFRRKP